MVNLTDVDATTPAAPAPPARVMPAGITLKLAGDFLWQGDLATLPKTAIGVALQAAPAKYDIIPDSGGIMDRLPSADPQALAHWFQPGGSASWAQTASAALLMAHPGQAANCLTFFSRVSNFWQTYEYSKGGGNLLAALAQAIDVQFTGPDGELLGQDRIETLLFMAGLFDPIGQEAYELEPLLSSGAEDWLADYAARHTLVIATRAFLDLKMAISRANGNVVLPDRGLLLAIAGLADTRQSPPALLDSPPAGHFQPLGEALGQGDPAPLDAAISAIRKAWPALFDLQLSTVPVHAQGVAGTVQLAMANGSMPSAADLASLTLAVDYETPDEAGDPEHRRVLFDWALAGAVLKNGAVAFDVFAQTPIFPAADDTEFTVSVRSADSMILWQNDYRAGNPVLQNLAIRVTVPGQGALLPDERAAASPKKLRGQIVDMTGGTPLKDARVAVQARGSAKEAWRTVASAAADSTGNFVMPYPLGVFSDAQALLSLAPDAPTAIPVRADDGTGATLSDDFLYLILAKAPPKPAHDDDDDDGDCGCTTGPNTLITRLPDHEDLINSDEYMQDLGGACLDLTTPNRTLQEYAYHAIVRTSDPDVAVFELARQGTQFALAGAARAQRRRPISLNNPIRWHDTASSAALANNGAGQPPQAITLYQTASIATGHVLHYRSQFRADGYSLGNLLYSLPLAPGQQKQIVVIDAAKSLTGAESQQLGLAERLSNSLTAGRDVADALSGTLSESSAGNSDAHTAGMSAGLGASASYGGMVGASLGIAGGFANSNSSAAQDGNRSISQFFQEKLKLNLMQNADSFRQQNASVISTVKEGQSYGATTEVVANHNHCHSMTIMYFEVMRHFAIFQELTGVEECVFVPLLMTAFDRDNVFKWQDVLASNLLPLPANAYHQSVNGRHPLATAFDAITRINVKYEGFDYPDGPFCNEQVTRIAGRLTALVNLPRPRTRYDRIMSLPIVTKQISHQEVDPEATAKNIMMAPFTFGLSMANGPAMKTVTENVFKWQDVLASNLLPLPA
ncbi:MAG: hypothetical protein WCO82_05925, partial [Sphingomonadales bacterium]